jgi:hypothetical protein
MMSFVYLDCQVDVVFALDTSNTVGASNWQYEQQYAIQVMQAIAVSTTGANFGLMTVGNDATDQFFLNNYTTIAQLTTAVSNIQFQTGQTALNLAVSCV